jgi:AAA domain
MACLIHVNGPPGIGKSTLSALYADRHPGTLNLDIDTLHRLVGGWQAAEGGTHEVLRPVALAMAAAHLGGGRDVILPQYLARLDEIGAFEDVALGQGAQFYEVVLLDDKTEAIARFDRRRDDTPWEQHNRRLVARQGGAVLLAAMYDQLLEILELRPSAVIVHSEPDAVEETYASLTQALLLRQSGQEVT